MQHAVMTAPGAAGTLQMITVMATNGDVRWVSPSVSLVLGVADLSSPHLWGPSLVHPGDRRAVGDAVARAAAGSTETLVHRMRHADGRWVAVRSVVQLLPAGGEEVVVALSTVVPDDEEDRAVVAARYRALVHESAEMLVIHVDGVVATASPPMCSLLGWDPEEVVGRHVFDFVAPGSTLAAHSRRHAVRAGAWPEPERVHLVTRQGSRVEVDVSSFPTMWEGRVAVQMTVRLVADGVAEAIRIATELVAGPHQAVVVTDPEHRIVSWNGGAVDLYGWQARETIGRPVDEVVRWVESSDTVEEVGRRLYLDGAWKGRARQIRADDDPVVVEMTTRLVRDSAGDAIAIVSVAEAVAGDVEARNDDALLSDVARAIDAGEIEVFYQPIVRPADGSLVKVEALVRWRHPERGLLPPAAFVPAVEASPLICRLGDEVLRQATTEVARWRAGPAPTIELTVNLSVRELADDELADRVSAALAASGLPPHALWLEVTETALAEDPDAAVAALQRLRSLGLRLALDDFGTGFAHLAQLRRFPVQALKIDRTFVSGMESHAGDAAIVRSVLALGRELGLTVVAEGVETEAQRAALVDLRCDLAQGYLFARPMPADEVLAGRSVGGAAPSGPTPEPDSPEAARLAALRSCAVLDTEPEPAFDALVELAADLADAPIAFFALVDDTRLWCKAAIGMPSREVPRAWALVDHVAALPEPVVVPDLLGRRELAENPLVVGDPGARAYAGVPVVLDDRHVVGVLAVVDRRPRRFDGRQVASLERLAAQVVAQLEGRRAASALAETEQALAQVRADLGDRERFLDAVLDTTNEVVCRLSPDGLIEAVNPASTRLLGIDPQAAIGMSGFDLVHPDDLPLAIEALAGTAAALGTAVPLHIRVRAPEGWRQVELLAHTVSEHDGQRRIVLTVRDLP